MPALPTVPLHTTPVASGIVLVILPHPIRVHRFGSVVRVEQDQGIVVDAEILYGVEETPSQHVQFMNKIPPWTGIRFTIELWSWEYRRVRNLGGEHHEERLLGKVLSVPGDELDGIALVCPTNKLAFLPDWAPDWLVPGWLEEKVNRLLRTLPKNLRGTISPIDQTAKEFYHTCAGVINQPLLDAVSSWLQHEFKLPVDASDFDETALPDFLRMKVIETKDDKIVRVHVSIAEEHRMNIHRSGAETAFAKWTLPPGKVWPGDTLPEFITSDDSN